MKKKNIINISIIILVLIICIILFFLLRIPKSNSGIATITDYNGYKAVYVKVNDKDNLIIYSTVFKVGDKVEVKYQKNGNTYEITDIEAIINTDEEKTQLVKNLNNDRKLDEYRNENVCKLYKNRAFINCDDIGVLPIKIKGQSYLKIITPEDYFELMKEPIINIFKDDEVSLTLTTNFKVLEFDNITDGVVKKVFYEIKENSINFKSLGSGIYSVKIEFENGDIINYIFV